MWSCSYINLFFPNCIAFKKHIYGYFQRSPYSCLLNFSCNIKNQIPFFISCLLKDCITVLFLFFLIGKENVCSMSDLNLCICLTIWKHLESWTWRRFHLYSVLGRKEWKSSTNCQGKQQSSILVVQFISWMVCWSNLTTILWFHHSDFRIYDSSRTVLSGSGSSQHPFAWKWLLELLGGQWKGGNRWELSKYFFFFPVGSYAMIIEAIMLHL